MRRANSHHRRNGFTLAELVVSILGSSILLLGLNSAVLIALRSNDTTLTPTQDVLEGAAVLNELAAELNYSLSVTEQTANAITFTVPDRDGDNNAETLRYSWAGTAGNPLQRQYNSGTVATVLGSVEDFQITYSLAASKVEAVNISLQVTSDSQTALEIGVPLYNRP